MKKFLGIDCELKEECISYFITCLPSYAVDITRYLYGCLINNCDGVTMDNNAILFVK